LGGGGGGGGGGESFQNANKGSEFLVSWGLGEEGEGSSFRDVRKGERKGTIRILRHAKERLEGGRKHEFWRLAARGVRLRPIGQEELRGRSIKR